jgi:hypothetical protein
MILCTRGFLENGNINSVYPDWQAAALNVNQPWHASQRDDDRAGETISSLGCKRLTQKPT